VAWTGKGSVSEISVTVVYALPLAATEIALRLPEGATIADALDHASVRGALSHADLARCPVGIFGRRSRRATVLADGDRVEVYRPLLADPKQTRIRRAANKRR
jgi:uncharacterized protein